MGLKNVDYLRPMWAHGFADLCPKHGLGFWSVISPTHAPKSKHFLNGFSSCAVTKLKGVIITCKIYWGEESHKQATYNLSQILEDILHDLITVSIFFALISLSCFTTNVPRRWRGKYFPYDTCHNTSTWTSTIYTHTQNSKRDSI